MKLASVTPIGARPSDHELSLRRQALQIAVQLPADIEDAERVLELALALLESFMSGRRPS